MQGGLVAVAVTRRIECLYDYPSVVMYGRKFVTQDSEMYG